MYRYGVRDEFRHEFSLGKSYVFVVGVLTQRGWSDSPASAAARVAFLSFLTGGVLLYFHWESMLISYLATRVTPIPFGSLEELLASSYAFYAMPGSSHWSAFKNGDGIWSQIYDEKLAPYEGDYVKFAKTGQEPINLILQDSNMALWANYFKPS